MAFCAVILQLMGKYCNGEWKIHCGYVCSLPLAAFHEPISFHPYARFLLVKNGGVLLM
jgi:hypothetical protein